MMNVADNEMRAWAIEKCASSVSLTNEQRDQLRAELQKPEYAGLGRAEILRKLNSLREVPNDPAPIDPIDAWEPDVLKNLLMQQTTPDGKNLWLTIKALSDSQDPQIAAIGKLIPDVFTLKAISLKNPLVQQALNALKQMGVLSDEQYHALHQRPRAGWPSTKLIQSVAEELFGYGAFIEPWDLEGL